MRKWKKILILTAAGVMLAGCGQKTETAAGTEAAADVSTEETQEAVTETEESTEAETETEETQNAEKEKETEKEAAKETAKETVKETEKTAAAEVEAKNEAADAGYEDNFSVDEEAAAEFGKKVKDAAAAGDLEELADLAAYPLYVGFPEGGETIESREELVGLGADRIFTEELKNAVAAADEQNLSPSMAGFVLSDGNGTANVIFGVRDGKLSINGINY